MINRETAGPEDRDPRAASRSRRRARGLFAGGIVALGIGAIYAAGVGRLLFAAHPQHASARGLALRGALLGALAILCMAIAIQLFRLARRARQLGRACDNSGATRPGSVDSPAQ